ncbi:MAG: endo alpha-1,4 polygalactosaminidase [Phycisphaerales bacterium]|nr:endo alpha-1,4 polygalactosaminidase [Phycisphaerales bacterium]
MNDTGNWYRPSVDATWQWQLQPGESGGINASYDVDVYDIDLFDNDAAQIAALQTAGRSVICYFSAGSYEDFREDADAFAPADIGNPLDEFPDERWIDIRSANVRQIMLARLDLAEQKGCDGVEPDNVTGFTNDTGFPLSAADQLAFNRFLADAAHDRGLAVGLKNDNEQILELVDDFDFAVNEQCYEFDECAALDAFIATGKPVFNAEYAEEYVTDPAARQALCADATTQGRHALILPIDLDDAFRFSCDGE